MTRWRMQLHPETSESAVQRTTDSLARGFIGLDFREDIGDLRGSHREPDSNQKSYLAFQAKMHVGDPVLIEVHNYPFALVEIAGDYVYASDEMRTRLGVWFRHLRLVMNVRYYADFETNPKDWESIPMPATIMPLLSEDGHAYALIERWSQRA